MTKTETEITKGNIDHYKRVFLLDTEYKNYCKKHKQSCERFLEFLEEKKEMVCGIEGCNEVDKSFTAYCIKHGRSPHKITFDNKITDLKQAIKKYDDAGI